MNRYINIELLKNKEGNSYLKNVITPTIPYSDNDLYIISNSEDRFDILAEDFYSNKDYWFIISWANPEIPKYSLYIPNGTQIRIPDNPEKIMESFNLINRNR